MLAMAQFFFRQQCERNHDQATSSVGSKRRVKTEEQPICHGYEEHAQSIDSQRKFETGMRELPLTLKPRMRKQGSSM